MSRQFLETGFVQKQKSSEKPSSVLCYDNLYMLEVCCFSQVEELKDVNVSYFQPDGAPAHYKGYVRDALNNKFQQRWVGRDFPKARPPRSPDFTSHYVFRIYVKNIVLFQKISNVAQIKDKDL